MTATHPDLAERPVPQPLLSADNLAMYRSGPLGLATLTTCGVVLPDPTAAVGALASQPCPAAFADDDEFDDDDDLDDDDDDDLDDLDDDDEEDDDDDEDDEFDDDDDLEDDDLEDDDLEDDDFDDDE